MCKTKYIVAPWCATNFYEKNKEKRAYIKNEITTEFFLLEDISALIWKKIMEKSSYTEILECALNYKESKEDIDSFISELKELNLIVETQQTINTNQGLLTLSISNKDVDCTNAEFENSMYSWFGKNKILAKLFIETTYRCNMNCIHCYNTKHLNNIDIEFEKLKQVIDDAYKEGLFSICLSGGETTISKDFLKIAKYIREKNISLEIYTNGLVFYNNEELIDEIANLYPSKVSLSLYSMKPEIHDKITQVSGSQKKILTVIKMLKEKNIRTEVKCFLTKYNYLEFVEVARFAEKNNINVMFDDKFFDNGVSDNSCFEVDDEQVYLIYKNFYEIFNENIPQKYKDKYSEIENKQPCQAGHFTLAIKPNMQIQMCNFFNEIVGDLNKNSIIEIWQEKNSECRKLTEWRNIRTKDLKECYQHEYCKFCFYCVGFSIAENNYLGKSERFCRVAKAKYRVMKEHKRI